MERDAPGEECAEAAELPDAEGSQVTKTKPAQVGHNNCATNLEVGSTQCNRSYRYIRFVVQLTISYTESKKVYEIDTCVLGSVVTNWKRANVSE